MTTGANNTARCVYLYVILRPGGDGVDAADGDFIEVDAIDVDRRSTSNG